MMCVCVLYIINQFFLRSYLIKCVVKSNPFIGLIIDIIFDLQFEFVSTTSHFREATTENKQKKNIYIETNTVISQRYQDESKY